MGPKGVQARQKLSAEFAGTKHRGSTTELQVAMVAEVSSKGAFEGADHLNAGNKESFSSKGSEEVHLYFVSEIWTTSARKTGVVLWTLAEEISAKHADLANVFKLI